MPQSLIARTALLIFGTILVFSLIAWQAIIWSAMGPAAELAAPLLTQRAQAAIAARQTGHAMPQDTRFETVAPRPMAPIFRGFAFRAYVDIIDAKLQANLGAPEIRIHRLAGPSEIWVRTREFPDSWLVLTWRIAGPKAPLAALGVLATAALLTLGAAAVSARKLSAPLAALGGGAARLAEGELVEVDTATGPREVRSLAVAFQSMSHRMADLNEQRELMMAGISHDLRTPLARLRVAVELQESADAALTAEMVASIEEMDRMVGQFLYYVRANYRETLSRCVPDELFHAALASYTQDDRLLLELQTPQERWLAINGVRHILMNLVQNALEYGRAPVHVRSSFVDNDIEIEVADHGEGLSDSQWAEAAAPFHRLRHEPSAGHTGLGLAMVHRLVRVCGGTIRPRQSAAGFSVTVKLPARPV